MNEFFMVLDKMNITFQFVVIGIGGEEHVWEELLEAVSSIAWPVFYVRSYRLVQLH